MVTDWRNKLCLVFCLLPGTSKIGLCNLVDSAAHMAFLKVKPKCHVIVLRHCIYMHESCALGMLARNACVTYFCVSCNGYLSRKLTVLCLL